MQNIFDTEELEQKQVCAKFAHTAEDRKTYNTLFYVNFQEKSKKYGIFYDFFLFLCDFY